MPVRKAKLVKFWPTRIRGTILLQTKCESSTIITTYVLISLQLPRIAAIGHVIGLEVFFSNETSLKGIVVPVLFLSEHIQLVFALEILIELQRGH